YLYTYSFYQERHSFPTRRSSDLEAKLELERARALHDLAIADKRRAQAERLAAIGRLASGVAHEINNPLAYVQSNLEMLTELARQDRKSTRLNSSHVKISYAVFCL